VASHAERQVTDRDKLCRESTKKQIVQTSNAERQMMQRDKQHTQTSDTERQAIQRYKQCRDTRNIDRKLAERNKQVKPMQRDSDADKQKWNKTAMQTDSNTVTDSSTERDKNIQRQKHSEKYRKT